MARLAESLCSFRRGRPRMIDGHQVRDLIVVVPDADMEFAIHALLHRTEALGIESIEFDVRRHIQRDAGCRSDCHNYLRLSLGEYRYAMVLFDHEGCGKEELERTVLEEQVEAMLRDNGWNNCQGRDDRQHTFRRLVLQGQPLPDSILYQLPVSEQRLGDVVGGGCQPSDLGNFGFDPAKAAGLFSTQWNVAVLKVP